MSDSARATPVSRFYNYNDRPVYRDAALPGYWHIQREFEAVCFRYLLFMFCFLWSNGSGDPVRAMQCTVAFFLMGQKKCTSGVRVV